MGNELYFENKKYLSSRIAGKALGYTSDYVARLCRQGKVKGRQVGRIWFADEESLFQFALGANNRKIDRSTELSRERKGEYPRESGKSSSRPGETLQLTVSRMLRPSPFFEKVVAIALALLITIGSYAFSSLVGLPSGEYIRALDKSVAAATEVYLHAGTLVDNTLSVGAAAVASLTEEGSRLLFEKGAFASALTHAKEKAKSFFYSLAVSWKSFFANGPAGEKRLLTRDDGSPAFEDLLPRQREGVVVVPHGDTQTSDEELQEQIQESFSDEVQIVPDETGLAGIIKPIFKYREAQEYLYVLVPVKE